MKGFDMEGMLSVFSGHNRFRVWVRQYFCQTLLLEQQEGGEGIEIWKPLHPSAIDD